MVFNIYSTGTDWALACDGQEIETFDSQEGAMLMASRFVDEHDILPYTFEYCRP